MKLAALLTDLLLIAGAGGVAFGVWRIDPNVGYIVAGSLLLAAGIARGRAEARSRVTIRKVGEK